ncbi:tyrosine-protein phosphatase [Isoptericola sp. NEAU-Y5]|uniref:Tyrosine-protein phosphatase n=1 Tax=Isoptericola luteus TaxID=2879484 RepID=A0ABS7ZEC2_9MICO|nr:tyrosine-protein phosphatase [Isoptericola sp. NEAU-Y5]MCA5892115.1 tyrosine-protein phosphatase [Isoptericola sp. NEAU-Y5]
MTELRQDPAPGHLVNLRDVATADEGLRPGVLLRSDAPRRGDAPPPGVVWPPRTVLDLRDLAEKRFEHPLAGTARVVDLPLLDGATTAGVMVPAMIPGLGELYLQILDGVGAARLVEAVGWVAAGHGPVLVHCTAGKDRTGVTVALVLALLGLPRQRIVADYEQTASNMPGVLARASATARLPEPDRHLLAALPPELLTAPGWAIETVLDRLEAHDGGAAGWFLARGGDVSTLDVLRSRLLVG